MGHSRSFQVSSQEEARPWKVHPIWRGFGCVMILIIPIMSYAGASLLIQMNTEQNWGFPIPYEFSRTVEVNIPSPVAEIPSLYWSVPNLYANLMLGFLLMLIGFGLLMVFYAVIYSMMGPSRLGPLDAKPVRSTPKKKNKDWRNRDITFRR